MTESTTDADRDLFVSREVRNWLSEIRISDTEMTRSQEDFVKFQIDEAYGKRINPGLRESKRFVLVSQKIELRMRGNWNASERYLKIPYFTAETKDS